MIIVSQDKTEIINFNKVDNIYVSGKFISIDFGLNNNEVIGQYATEERAKEVLINIGQCYCNTKSYEFVSNMPDYLGNKSDYLNKLSEKAVVYQMPKE